MKNFIFYKRVLAALFLALGFIPIARGQSSTPIDTQDKFVVSELEPYEDFFYFVVSLEGGKDDPDRRYCAYNMTITLPAGLNFVVLDGALQVYSTEDESFYPCSKGMGGKKTFPHHVSGAVQENLSVAKVICYSDQNDSFLASSGDLFAIYVQPTQWAKAGANEVKLTGLNLTVKENAQKYIPTGDLNTGTVTLPEATDLRSVEISISATNQYGTYILPFDCTLPDGLTAYEVTGYEDSKINAAAVAKMSAYKPYIIYAPSGFTGTVQGTADGAAYPADGAAVVEVNGMCGVIAKTEVSAGYVLQNKGEGAQFYKIGSAPFVLNAGRCYLSPSAVNLASAPANIPINFGETSVIQVNSDRATDGVYFNLLGQPVAPTRHGVYIYNGKKIIKK